MILGMKIDASRLSNSYPLYRIVRDFTFDSIFGDLIFAALLLIFMRSAEVKQAFSQTETG